MGNKQQHQPADLAAEHKPRCSRFDDGYREPDDPEHGAYQPVSKVSVKGATDQDGRAWVEFSTSTNITAWVPLDELMGSADEAKRKLRDAGIILFDEQLAKAIKQAKQVRFFPDLPLFARPGWSLPYFVQASGKVFGPAGSAKPVILFERHPTKCSAKGKLTSWLDGVAELATGQHLLIFSLMIGFVGPLLGLSRLMENFGFELVGPKARGKTTLQYLLASVAGPALRPSGQNNWIGANTTMNAFEAQMPEHADTTMIVDEMTTMFANESSRSRGKSYQDAVFRLAQGTGKDRYGSTRQRPARFVWITSTNEQTHQLVRTVSSDAADAASDRLMALPISRKARGVFQKPFPAGYKTGERVARAITELVAGHYGRPFRKFLTALVAARAEDEAGLKVQIEEWIDQFREAVGVSGNAGSEARVADAMGLVYAAGMLAQSYGALPPELNCLEAAQYCHRLNRASVRADLTNVERVQQLAAHKRTLEIDTDVESKGYRKRLDRAPALIKVRRDGTRELVLTADMLIDAGIKRKAFLNDPAIRRLLRHDEDRDDSKLKLVSGGKATRVICIRLPQFKPNNDN